MPPSWFLIDVWLSNRQGNDLDHVLFRKIDGKYLSTIKELIAKVGDGRYVCDGDDDVSDWRKLRVLHLTPSGLSVVLEVFGAVDEGFDVRAGTGFTVSEIDKISRVIACPHCIGDEFWVNQFGQGEYTMCDHQSI